MCSSYHVSSHGQAVCICHRSYHSRKRNVMGHAVEVFLGWCATVVVMLVYGSATHAERRHDVVAYFKFWPCAAPCDMTLDNNPFYHPDHCKYKSLICVQLNRPLRLVT